MSNYTRVTRWRANPMVRTGLFVLGMVLMIGSPAVGIIPGPGGVIVFAAGLALALQNSRWAKRQYVRFKRWQPQAGRWTDWGLRRRSAKRREAIVAANQPPNPSLEQVQSTKWRTLLSMFNLPLGR